MEILPEKLLYGLVQSRIDTFVVFTSMIWKTYQILTNLFNNFISKLEFSHVNCWFCSNFQTTCTPCSLPALWVKCYSSPLASLWGLTSWVLKLTVKKATKTKKQRKKNNQKVVLWTKKFSWFSQLYTHVTKLPPYSCS